MLLRKLPVPYALDLVLLCTLFAAVCPAFCISRMGLSVLSVVLAAILTAGLSYGTSVMLLRLSKRKGKCGQEEVLSRLSEMEQTQALSAVRAAVVKRFHLSRTKEGIFAPEMPDTSLSICFCPLPEKVRPDLVYAFHKEMGNRPAVLVCRGGFTKEAETYAENLPVPLRLLEASSLSFPGLSKEPRQKPQHRRKRRLLSVSPVKGFLLGSGLLLLFIGSGKSTYLLGGLILLFLSLLAKPQKAGTERLF